MRLFHMAGRMLRFQDGLYLGDILDRLLQREDLSHETVLQYLQASGHVPSSSLPIIEVGLRRLWERDWVSALHVLIPPLEEVMRSILRNAGHDTMRRHREKAG